MKTEFPILNISPTQWVLVDKTRKPRKGENCISLEDDELYMEIFIYDGRFDDMTEEEIDEEGLLNQTFPILAAYPKIEGVLLLPSTLWEKPEINEAFEKHINYFLFRDAPITNEKTRSVALPHFKAGYEAAGGYTKDDMIDLLSWYASLSPSEKVSVWSKDGSQQGLFTMDNEQLVDRFIEKRSKWPRALEIDVNEDGSIPSENGVIIYKKAIY